MAHQANVNEEEIIKEALEVCRLERVMIGNTYLPEFFLDKLISGNEFFASKHAAWLNFDECVPVGCTGRLFADLSLEKPVLFIETKSRRLIEIPLLPFAQKEQELSLTTIRKAENTLIYILTKYCTKRSLHFFQMIQPAYLRMRNVYEEIEQQKFVHNINEECKQYPSSIQVYDIADLVHVQKNESNPESEGFTNSVSFSVTHSNLMETIFQIFNDSALIDDSDRYKREHWVVIISKHNHLTNIFQEKCRWLESQDKIRERERQELAEQLRRCINCMKMYCEKDNDYSVCGTHKGKLWELDTLAQTQTNLTDKDAAEALPIVRQQKVIWDCCLGALKSKGCVESKHIP